MRAFLGLVACVGILFLSLPAFGATVALKDLTPQQAASLSASQDRLATFDRALLALDQLRARHKISLREYNYREHDLLAFIANEAEFQNAILHKESAPVELLPEKAAQGLEMAGAILGEVAVLVGLKALASIH